MKITDKRETQKATATTITTKKDRKEQRSGRRYSERVTANDFVVHLSYVFYS